MIFVGHSGAGLIAGSSWKINSKIKLSHKYEVERMELKEKITVLREKLIGIGAMKSNKDHFIGAVCKFMEMQTLTVPLLWSISQES